jgi:hypothetical protein
MKTIVDINLEIALSDNAIATFQDNGQKRKMSAAIAHNQFLRMCKHYIESSNETSIRRQFETIVESIAIHEKRITEMTARIEFDSVKKAMAAAYGKRVGLTRLREYHAALKYIVDDIELSGK